MATVTATPIPQVVAHSVEKPMRPWVDWVTTTDHKKIGIMYLVLTFAFFGTDEGVVKEAASRLSEKIAPSDREFGIFFHRHRMPILLRNPLRKRTLEEMGPVARVVIERHYAFIHLQNVHAIPLHAFVGQSLEHAPG